MKFIFRFGKKAIHYKQDTIEITLKGDSQSTEQEGALFYVQAGLQHHLCVGWTSSIICIVRLYWKNLVMN